MDLNIRNFLNHPPSRVVHSIHLCNLSRESTVQPSACEATTLPMQPHTCNLLLSAKYTYTLLLPAKYTYTSMECLCIVDRVIRANSQCMPTLVAVFSRNADVGGGFLKACRCWWWLSQCMPMLVAFFSRHADVGGVFLKAG